MAVFDQHGEGFVDRDSLGPELTPIIRQPQSAVFGHKVHGQDMTHGYATLEPSSEDQETWSENDCNVVLQSKLHNYCIWDFPSDVYSKLRSQVANLSPDSV